MKTLHLFAIIIPLLAIACGLDYSKELIGSWQAVEVTQEGAPMDLSPEEVNMSFDNDGRYRFQGTLNYIEAGSYYLEKDLLYTLDTINGQSVQKVVQITDLQNDSLTIRMQAGDQQQVLKLVRQ